MNKQRDVEVIELLTDSEDEAGDLRGAQPEQQASCLICFTEGPDVLQLGCPGSHSFCGPCLTQWLTSGDPAALLDGAAKLPHCPSCKAGPGPPGHVPIEVRLPLRNSSGYRRMVCMVVDVMWEHWSVLCANGLCMHMHTCCTNIDQCEDGCWGCSCC
jgi:hypothetical protein